MSSYSNSDPFTPGMKASNFTENDWIFQDNTSLNPIYEGNFEADIDAIAESVGDDSGYFSNDDDSFEASNADVPSHEGPPPPVNLGYKPSVHSDTFYVDMSGSDKSNHSSVDYTTHKSTTHLERGTSPSKQRKETRITKTLYDPVHNYEHKTLHKYSAMEYSSASSPLEPWKSTFERHEWIAYRLEQPPNPPSSKKRKTAGRK